LQNLFDDGHIDLVFTQDEGTKVFPTLAKILEMLPCGLPAGTHDERCSLLQGEPLRATFIAQQVQPDHREMAIARRIWQLLGRHPMGPHAEALDIHFHCELARV
jgi:hypothetical protein